jgi:hypothetical protein
MATWQEWSRERAQAKAEGMGKPLIENFSEWVTDDIPWEPPSWVLPIMRGFVALSDHVRPAVRAVGEIAASVLAIEKRVAAIEKRLEAQVVNIQGARDRAKAAETDGPRLKEMERWLSAMEERLEADERRIESLELKGARYK